MIGYLAGLIIISIVIAYFWKKDLVYIIPMSVLTSIIILYFFSIFNMLLAGVYAIYVIALIGVALFIYAAIRYKMKFFKSISLTPIIIIVIFGIISLWAHRGRMITLWDEFSHWGRVVKDMFYLDALGTHPKSMVIFQSYPPGSALLQYLFMEIRGAFVEAELYHGINIIYFALILPLFKDLKAKNIFQIIITVLIAIILPTAFYDTMHESLYVDGLLGIFFAYTLFVYFTNKFSTFNFINIAIALFVLTIMKPAGTGLAILVIFVILVDFCFANRAKSKQYFKNNNMVTALICIMLPIIFVVVAKISWSTYLDVSNARISFDVAKITFAKIIDVFARFNGTEAQNKILFNFLKAFVTLSNSNSYANFIFNIPPITFIVLFIFIGVKLFYVEKNPLTKKRILITSTSLLVSSLIYVFTLLCSYLFLFTEYEALRLASFTRYLSTYFLGVYVFIVGYVLHRSKNEEIAENRIPKYLLVFFIIILITGLEAFLSITVLAPFSTQRTVSIREPYAPIGEIKEIVDEDELVYFIDIGSEGYSYYVGDYVSYPVRLKGLGSIGESKYYEGDIWTRIVTPEELEEDLLANYNYLYVYKIRYDFAEKYGYLFGGADEITELTLYYVDKSASEIILIKVEK